jgi:hypothetical protein
MPYFFTLLFNLQMGSGRGTFDTDAAVADAIRTLLGIDTQVHLFQTSLTPNFNTLKADFEANEADFTGYATTDIAAWTATITDPDGGKSFQSGIQTFAMTATTVTNKIGGWFLVNGDGFMLGYGLFDTPITIAAIGAGIAMNVEVNVK